MAGIDTDKAKKEYSEAVFLRYVDGKPLLDSNQYPAYFSDELGILDALKLHKELISSKMLMKQGDIYVLSEKGAVFLDSHQYELAFFDSAVSYMTWEDFVSINGTERDGEFDTKLFDAMVTTGYKLREKQVYPEVSNVFRDIASVLRSQGDLVNALYYYIVAVYYDYSGIKFYNSMLMYMNGNLKKKALLDNYSTNESSAEVVKAIYELKEEFSPDMIDRAYSTELTNINLCGIDDFRLIIDSMLEGKYDREFWNDKMYKNYIKIIKVADEYRQQDINALEEEEVQKYEE